MHGLVSHVANHVQCVRACVRACMRARNWILGEQFAKLLTKVNVDAADPELNRPPPMTTCAIKGCTFGTVVHSDHKCCNQCGRVFYNMFAQMNNLCDDDHELNMCCSMECKRRCKRSKKRI
jgi:hypothetical protein